MPDSIWIALATAAAPQLEVVGVVSRHALDVGVATGHSHRLIRLVAGILPGQQVCAAVRLEANR